MNKWFKYTSDEYKSINLTIGKIYENIWDDDDDNLFIFIVDDDGFKRYVFTSSFTKSSKEEFRDYKLSKLGINI